MIKSFKCKETKAVYDRNGSRKIAADAPKVAYRKLLMLNNAQTLADLKVPPNNHLEALKDDRKGQHSIRINDKWRICFVWKDNEAHDVEIVDYH